MVDDLGKTGASGSTPAAKRQKAESQSQTEEAALDPPADGDDLEPDEAVNLAVQLAVGSWQLAVGSWQFAVGSAVGSKLA